MSTHLQFTPSATASLVATGIASVAALPAPDASNPVVVIQNLGPGVATVAAGALPGQNLFGVYGAMSLPPGASHLVSSPSLSTASTATVQAMGNATLTFQRGQTAPVWLFTAPDAVVM